MGASVVAAFEVCGSETYALVSVSLVVEMISAKLSFPPSPAMGLMDVSASDAGSCANSAQPLPDFVAVPRPTALDLEARLPVAESGPAMEASGSGDNFAVGFWDGWCKSRWVVAH